MLFKSLFKIKKTIGQVELVTAKLNLSRDTLNSVIDSLLQNLTNGVVLIASIIEGRAQLTLRVNPSLCEKINAKEIMQELSKLIQGGGGGNAKNAQASGKNPQGFDHAFSQIITYIQSRV